MDQKYIIGIVALIVGALLGANVSWNKPGQQNVEVREQMTSNMHDTMEGMMSGLEEKTGADFDKAFLSEMIVHHEGAIEMAKQALEKAERQEIKDMANNIITAQETEIEQMKQWQQDWQ